MQVHAEGKREHSLQPWDLAWETQLASVEVDMYPLVASLLVAGFPMTSLLDGTPDAAIWNRAVWGQVELDAVSRPEQVVYSEVPSVFKLDISIRWYMTYQKDLRL